MIDEKKFQNAIERDSNNKMIVILKARLQDAEAEIDENLAAKLRSSSS